jgi:hypothetical protein
MIYEGIAQELTHLVELSIEFGALEPDWYGNEDQGPEAWLEEGQEVKDLTLGYCEPNYVELDYSKRFRREYTHDPQAVARDEAALRRLHAIVDQRRCG